MTKRIAQPLPSVVLWHKCPRCGFDWTSHREQIDCPWCETPMENQGVDTRGR